jgi:Carboxylesterase family/Gram-negative bacterial TonB protein C-terminal
LAQQLGAKTIADLRTLPVEKLMNASAGNYFPIIDGYVLPTNAYQTFKENRQNDVPLLTGWNAGDKFPAQNPLSAKNYKKEAKKKYGPLAATFLKNYPAKNDAEANNSQMQITGDRLFAWQNYTWAKMQSENTQNKAYLYHFSHLPPQNAGQPDYGAFHSAEFGYALHTLAHWKRPFVQNDKDLEEIMSSYWVNFATIGDPNGIGLPRWAAFDLKKQQTMIFGEKAVLGGLPDKERMEFWDLYEGNTPILIDENEEIFEENVNNKAFFKAGEAEYLKFTKENIVYPQEAKKNNVKGKCILDFVVEKDGSIQYVRIFKDIGFGCGKECMRMVLSMSGAWKPAIINGKPVRSRVKFEHTF